MRRCSTVLFTLLAVAAPGSATDQPAAETPAIRLAPAPSRAATRELVHLWHDDYRRQITPVLREWETLTRLVRQRPGNRLIAGCHRLERALDGFDQRPLAAAPDRSISLHLEQALRALGAAATSCTHGAYFLSIWRLRQADDAWRQLRRRLLLYDLAP